MLTHTARLTAAAAMFAVIGSLATPAHAVLDSIDLSVTAAPGAAAAPGSVEDDEDTFFSGGRKGQGQMTTGSIATIGAVPSSATRPMVDIQGTCRAVLADQPAFYHDKFLAACKRAVTQGTFRR